jgi:DNA-binding transcriptional LysR family regulator
MNIPDMQALVAVVETGSLARAAVKLNLTQPAVTRRIQRLEEVLGAALLDRDVKPARVTAEGEVAYAECVRVLSAADGLKSAIAREPRSGRALRIGVSLGAADLILPGLLPAPAEAGLVTIETRRSPSLESAVAERRYDAVFVLRDGSRSDEPGERIAHMPVRVVAPSAFDLSRRVRLGDLRGRRWVLCPDGCGYRRALEFGLYGAAQPLDVAAAIWGFATQAQLVAAGVGLGLLPLRIIAECPARDAFQVLEVDDFSAALDLWMARPPGFGARDPRLDALLSTLRRHMDEPLALAS